jgi:hypothetical protein
MANGLREDRIGLELARNLRCAATHRYWTDRGWTHNAKEAAVFQDEVEAVRACVSNQLSEVELVLRVPASGTEIFATRIR